MIRSLSGSRGRHQADRLPEMEINTLAAPPMLSPSLQSSKCSLKFYQSDKHQIEPVKSPMFDSLPFCEILCLNLGFLTGLSPEYSSWLRFVLYKKFPYVVTKFRSLGRRLREFDALMRRRCVSLSP